MKKLALLAVLTGLSTPALAADAIIFNEPTAAESRDSFNWAGGYIGVNAGYAWGKDKTAVYWFLNDHDFSPVELHQNLRGALGGAQTGYNWQSNKIVWGLETDLQLAGLNTTPIENEHETDFTVKMNWLGTTRARIGYTPADNLLLYATAGLAFAGIKSEAEGYYTPVSPLSKTKFGYAAGAGAEYAIAKNWTIKTEYLFADLGKTTHTIAYWDPQNIELATHKLTAHIARIGVNYKF